MANFVLAIICCATLLIATAGARAPLQVAEAPAPSSNEGANVLFMLSADKATFTSPNTLLLEWVSKTAASFGVSGRASAYPLPEFVSATPGSPFVAAAGGWLGQPDALLTGTAANSSQAEALLVLSQPIYDMQSRTLSFQISQLPPQTQNIKYGGGAVSDAIAQYQAGTGPALLQQSAAGTVLEGVVIFIDNNQQTLDKPAQDEFGWGGSDSSLNFGGYNGGMSSGGNGPPPPGRDQNG